MSQRSLTLQMAPKFMKTLLVLGTAAMFLVGGGIPVHGIGPAAEALHYAEELAHALRMTNGLAAVLAGVLVNGLFGLVAGGLLVAAGGLVKRLLPRRPAGPESTWNRFFVCRVRIDSAIMAARAIRAWIDYFFSTFGISGGPPRRQWISGSMTSL